MENINNKEMIEGMFQEGILDSDNPKIGTLSYIAMTVDRGDEPSRIRLLEFEILDIEQWEKICRMVDEQVGDNELDFLVVAIPHQIVLKLGASLVSLYIKEDKLNRGDGEA